jgi:hypothetical protein
MLLGNACGDLAADVQEALKAMGWYDDLPTAEDIRRRVNDAREGRALRTEAGYGHGPLMVELASHAEETHHGTRIGWQLFLAGLPPGDALFWQVICYWPRASSQRSPVWCATTLMRDNVMALMRSAGGAIPPAVPS